MRYLYSTLFYFAIPLILIRLAWKSKQGKNYFHYLKERFGYGAPFSVKPSIWVHAVSVGETIAAAPLVKELQKNYPDTPFIITSMTATGAERARALMGEKVHYSYVPYDLPGAVKRFLRRAKPRLLIIIETEIWPNLLHYCHEQSIPVLLANARLSAKSANGYAKLGKFTQQMLSNITCIAAQNQQDANRFLDIGANPQKLSVVGSVKFDQTIPASAYEKAAYFKTLWNNDRPVWVAASTHEGEEEQVLAAFKRILNELPNTLLILVPRHPERFAKVTALCKKQGFKTQLRSENQPCANDIQIFIGDSMGELCAYYGASQVAFVGGSLVPTGGHNLLEPAALGIPALSGPHVFNFAEITAMLTQAEAATLVANEEELAQKVTYFLKDATLRSNAGEHGQKVIEQNRGSLSKHVEIIYNLLNESVR